jgi:hypothetical protein
MRIIIYNAEAIMASLCIILTFLSILICIEIMTKSSGKLKKSAIFFFVALISSIIYVIGRIMNIEERFTAGKFFSLTLNTITIVFILIGLIMINKLIQEISKDEKINTNNSIEKPDRFLISAIKRYKKWTLLQKDTEFFWNKAMFMNWLKKGGYGKSEKDIFKKLEVTKDNFTRIFNEYKRIK